MELKEAKEISLHMLGNGWIEPKEGDAIVTVIRELENSISKSKIEEKIKEFSKAMAEKQKECAENDTYSYEISAYDWGIDMLKELLEEE